MLFALCIFIADADASVVRRHVAKEDIMDSTVAFDAEVDMSFYMCGCFCHCDGPGGKDGWLNYCDKAKKTVMDFFKGCTQDTIVKKKATILDQLSKGEYDKLETSVAHGEVCSKIPMISKSSHDIWCTTGTQALN